MQKLCLECGQPFVQLAKKGVQRFCSKSCRMKQWNRKRHEANPGAVRAEWRWAHERNREKRNARMRARHERMKEQDNATNRAARNRRLEYYQEYDRQRWVGERKEQMNEKRGENLQKTRLASPWKGLLKNAFERATKKNVAFELTEVWAREAWTGKCALTGIEFGLGQRGWGPKIYSPSIDRIVPALGYIPSNCRFVIWAVNAFKYDGTDEDMYRIAEAILRNRPLIA